MDNLDKGKTHFLYGAVVFFSMIFTSVALILFWPQQNSGLIVKVTVKSGFSLFQLAQQMKDNKLITNKSTFMWAAQLMGKERKIPIGTFHLEDAINNYSIIQQLVNGSPELKKITFLEGWTIRQFADHLAFKLDLKADEIIRLANRNTFLRRHQISGSSAEGYLFPDTYLFSDHTDPESILDILINEGRKFWTKAREYRATAIGLTKHEILTLASIIEGEAIYDDERPIISAVYHNRLNNGMKLQADPTIQYIIDDGPRRLLNRDLQIKSPYNTYLHKGLPPGPINSPGKKSLLAALYPEENDYLFFVAKGDGYHTFSKTERGHNRAKKKLQKLRRALKKNRIK
tara:strand:- start:944 stop:1975 length:1032 start_codon:yes stop_codon:yes gene_type:complete